MRATNSDRKAGARIRWIPLAVLALATGCHREEIRVYRAPKEKPAEVNRGAHSHTQPQPSVPSLTWKLPEGWEERGAGRMSVATFGIDGKDGQRAEVSVMPMMGESAGNLSLLVNIVRESSGLPKINDDELARLVQPVEVAGATAKLVDLSGATVSSGESKPDQIILAVLIRDGTTWFFKMAGSAALVSAQKGAFLDFLKSIAFREADASSVAAVRGTPVGSASDASDNSQRKPMWEIPGGWKEVPPTQMLIARFLLPGDSGAQSEVTVSVFPGDVGGLLANVNRWRGQIGLANVADSELSQLVTSLDVDGGKAMLVDMNGQDAKTGQKARLIGVILPRGNETWFYKFRGDAAAVERERQAFLKFVQSAKHPDAA